ncbi:MAG: phosphoglycerate dehydrogenase [Gemmatimonadaceae bacterium]|nr:phosphoglycerate dehydrogenase [Gemmatimonadaceae bacterium]
MPHILVTDEIDPEGVALLRATPSFVIDELPTLPAAELLGRIAPYDAIVGRSATRITGELLRVGTKLRVVGRAGVGVDNIALDVATELGIAVINAPAGNTIAVAELFFGTLISLLRHVPRADRSMHEGRWERGDLMGSELLGKTIGIVGLGRIGGEVATRAAAFGMEIIAYDPYVAPERFAAKRARQALTLDALLDAADVVTVHTPLTEETTGMIGAAELARLRPGAVVCNLARGGIVQEEALRDACARGALRGAVVDAFTSEPLKGTHAWTGADRILLTPHLGASTVEAQRNVAVDCCAAVRDALLHGDLSRSINVASSAADLSGMQSALQLTRRAAAIARALLASDGARAIDGIIVKCGAELAVGSGALVSAAAAGALEGIVESERLNLINARQVAEARGIALAFVGEGEPPHARAIEVRVRAGGVEQRVGGVAALDAAPRVTRIGAFRVDVAPRGTLIVLSNHDVPGVIGRVGTALGDAAVNIAEYHQARLAQGGDALAVISADGVVDESVRARLAALPDVRTATVVRFLDG